MMIEGIEVTSLKQISDNRGKVMHMIRSDSVAFQEFGEVYFSCVYPGAIKGWNMHKQMIINCCVPFGNLKFVLYDNRPESPTRGKIQEIFMGSDNYSLVTIPPLVWNSFKCMGTEMAILANCASIKHDPNEILRRDIFDDSIPYDWSKQINE